MKSNARFNALFSVIFVYAWWLLFRTQANNKDLNATKMNEMNVKHIEDLSEKIRSLSLNKVCCCFTF